MPRRTQHERFLARQPHANAQVPARNREPAAELNARPPAHHTLDEIRGTIDVDSWQQWPAFEQPESETAQPEYRPTVFDLLKQHDI